MEKNKKACIASILNFATAAFAVIYIVFSILDISVFHISFPEGGSGDGSEAGRAIGVALMWALSVYFNYIPLGIMAIFAVLKGILGLTGFKKSKPTPKWLLILTFVFRGIALVSNVFFTIYFVSLKMWMWSVLLLVVSALLIASSVLDIMAKKDEASYVPPVSENVVVESFGEDTAA